MRSESVQGGDYRSVRHGSTHDNRCALNYIDCPLLSVTILHILGDEVNVYSSDRDQAK